ncbi:MAG: hypothetical protein H7Y86_01880 [Rhizobacter sp.]|nr:hypothetical protein [Ferruginibacter sp.]
MKKFLLLFTLLTSLKITAQNVGIGTVIPATKLSISGAETAPNGLAAGIQISNTAPGGGNWYLRSGATGTTTPPGGFSIGNLVTCYLSINNNGFTGLLNTDPEERLHLGEGNIKIDNSTKGIILNAADRPFITRGFDPFTSGLYNGLGRWGIFMEGSRLTMGIPNMPGKAFELVKYELNSTRSSLFGVDVNGAVQVAGNSGAPGQVLTSGGTGATVWKNSALTNSTRFSVNYATVSGATVFVPWSTTRYNLDPANIVISGTTITLTKGGLYHFDVYVYANTGYASATAGTTVPSITAELDVDQPGLYTIVSERLQGRENFDVSADLNFDYGKLVSIEVYVAPGSAIRLRTLLNAPGAGGYFTNGYINGHLVSE